jgi:hypothetical protein
LPSSGLLFFFKLADVFASRQQEMLIVTSTGSERFADRYHVGRKSVGSVSVENEIDKQQEGAGGSQ